MQMTVHFNRMFTLSLVNGKGVGCIRKFKIINFFLVNSTIVIRKKVHKKVSPTVWPLSITPETMYAIDSVA